MENKYLVRNVRGSSFLSYFKARNCTFLKISPFYSNALCTGITLQCLEMSSPQKHTEIISKLQQLNSKCHQKSIFKFTVKRQLCASCYCMCYRVQRLKRFIFLVTCFHKNETNLTSNNDFYPWIYTVVVTRCHSWRLSGQT